MASPSASQDALRSARLWFSREILDGTISEQELATRAEVVSAFRSRPVPTAGLRVAQRLAMKGGRLDFESGFLASALEARRAMLGARAGGPPRFLIRVDEFPDSSSLDDPRRGLAAARAFHETLSAEGVPYLMAIVPQYTHHPLDPDATGGRALGAEDRAFIDQMRRERVTFAQHGTTHRTRHAGPRRRSELCGLTHEETDTLIADGRDRLADLGVFTRIFVPPFNRFDADQFPNLARHFVVIGGGPESVPRMGFHGGPLWRGDAVFLPCYAPFYARAAEVLPAIDRIVDGVPGVWIPLVLHVAWEIDSDFRDLAAVARKVASYAASWEDFLRAVDASRAASGAHTGPRSEARS